MAERGKLYLWPRNRSFGDSKPRPVLVLAPDAATRHGRRWVVLPLSSEPQLARHPLAHRLEPSAANGLGSISFVMAWLPTTVLAEQLEGPIGRISALQMVAIADRVTEALDLACLEPWQEEP